jgi:hypothetical protein
MSAQEALKLIISGGNYVPTAIGAATSMQAELERRNSERETEPIPVG